MEPQLEKRNKYHWSDWQCREYATAVSLHGEGGKQNKKVGTDTGTRTLDLPRVKRAI